MQLSLGQMAPALERADRAVAMLTRAFGGAEHPGLARATAQRARVRLAAGVLQARDEIRHAIQLGRDEFFEHELNDLRAELAQ